MAKEQTKTQKWMGDQKTGKTCELTKRQTQQAKKPRRKANPVQDWKTTKDWLTPGYGKRPSISPWEGHQKNSQTRTQLYLQQSCFFIQERSWTRKSTYDTKTKVKPASGMAITSFY